MLSRRRLSRQFFKPDREAFKGARAPTYPDPKPRAIPNNAGQLLRLVHEMKLANLVLHPSKQNCQVHIGKVEGPYRYHPAWEAGYPNLRPANWMAVTPRARFSQGALYEIGSAVRLFQMQSHADEFWADAQSKALLLV
jgi:restriction system protein